MGIIQGRIMKVCDEVCGKKRERKSNVDTWW